MKLQIEMSEEETKKAIEESARKALALDVGEWAVQVSLRGYGGAVITFETQQPAQEPQA